MNTKLKSIFGLILIITLIYSLFLFNKKSEISPIVDTKPDHPSAATQQPKKPVTELHPMAIEKLRGLTITGGTFTIEQTLSNGSNYKQYIASYASEGYKIFGLLTVPTTPKPEGGFPAIVFVHGYIPPKEYVTTKNYTSYQTMLAKNGFVTFKPDLRGHGNSEGEPVTAHFSEKYVIDTLEAISYLKQHADVNPSKIGYWGHSNGGETGLRILVVSHDIKAASLWAGVVGSFPDMLEIYNQKIPFLKDTKDPLIVEHGLPDTNPDFWKKIDPYSYLDFISAPIELHHGTNDASVPIELSRRLQEELLKINKRVTLYEYAGDDHNISKNFDIAWQKTIAFFKKELQ